MLNELLLEIKADSLNAAGEFEGWAATYGNIDSQQDRIQRGAFAADVGKQIPLLWAHQASEVIGTGVLEDTPDGLRVKGTLLLDTQAGREAYSRLRAGAARGLSVGFKLLKHAYEGAVRLIQEGRIAEVSLTPFPANPAAVVTAVKQDGGGTCHARELLELLRQ
jgi:uncharacterized protein